MRTHVPDQDVLGRYTASATDWAPQIQEGRPISVMADSTQAVLNGLSFLYFASAAVRTLNPERAVRSVPSELAL